MRKRRMRGVPERVLTQLEARLETRLRATERRALTLRCMIDARRFPTDATPQQDQASAPPSVG